MIKDKSKIALLAIMLLIVQMVSPIMAVVKAEETDKYIEEVTVTYPKDKDSLVATVGKGSLNFMIKLGAMEENESVEIIFGEGNNLNYGISNQNDDKFTIEATKTGFKITAIKKVVDGIYKLDVPIVYNKNVEGTVEKQLSFSLNGIEKIVPINVTENKTLVNPNEIIRKVAYGKSSETGNLLWGIFYNYNQFQIKGNEAVPFKIVDAVGTGHEIVKSSIIVYTVPDPIKEDGSRNTNVGTYSRNYEIEAIIKNSVTSNADGFNYFSDNFKGFPLANGDFLAPNTAIYITYVTKITDPTKTLFVNNISAAGNLVGDGVGNNPVAGKDDAFWSPLGGSTGGSEDLFGHVSFQKVSEADQNLLLAGAEFEIKNKDNQVVDQIVTEEQGLGKSTDLPYGTYQLIETKAPVGYILNPTPISFTINKNQTEIDLGKITNLAETPTTETTETTESTTETTDSTTETTNSTTETTDSTTETTNSTTETTDSTTETTESTTETTDSTTVTSSSTSETTSNSQSQSSDKKTSKNKKNSAEDPSDKHKMLPKTGQNKQMILIYTITGLVLIVLASYLKMSKKEG